MEQWPEVLYPLVLSKGNDLDKFVKEQLLEMHQPLPPDLRAVADMMSFCFDRLPFVLNSVPANVSEVLVKFKQSSNPNEATAAWSLTPHKNYDTIKSDFTKLLSFLYYNKCPLLDPLIEYAKLSTYSLEHSFKLGLIPQFIVLLLKDESHWVDGSRQNWLIRFASLFCFSLIKQKKEIQLKETGYAAQKLSFLLHLARVGSAGFILGMYEEAKLEGRKEDDLTRLCLAFSEEMQRCHAINWLARNVHILRNQAMRKPIERKVFVDMNQNIIIDQHFKFLKEDWSAIVVTLSNELSKLMEYFFAEDKESLDLFLDLRNQIQSPDLLKAQCGLLVHGKEKTIQLSALKVRRAVESIPGRVDQDYLDKLYRMMALIEFGLFSFGGGAQRLDQVYDLETTKDFHWQNHLGQDLYYPNLSRKQASTKRRTQHRGKTLKLPRVFARYCLLFRRIVVDYIYRESGVQEADLEQHDIYFIPRFDSSRKYFMGDAAGDLFGYSGQRIGHVIIRQLFTSIMNLLFPSEESEKVLAIVSRDKVSEQSGHTARTAIMNYSTSIEGGEERFYEAFHNYIGAPSIVVDNQTVVRSVIPKSKQVECLRALLKNKDAELNPLQAEAVNISCNFPSRHMLSLQPAGCGKTMNLLIPCCFEVLNCYAKTMRILVEPYKFLNGFLEASIRKQLKNVSNDLRVVSYTLKDMKELEEGQLPIELKEESDLPSILILTVDAFCFFVEQLYGVVQEWSAKGRLTSIYLDEIHTFISEHTFRSDTYRSFAKVAQFGVRVVGMSGSLTLGLAKAFMKELNLSSRDDLGDMSIVKGGNPLGEGHFELQIEYTKNTSPLASAIKIVTEAKSGVHILCSRKSEAEAIHKALKDKEFNCGLATSDSLDEDREQAANAWANGELDILTTTSLGVVGNENKNCRVILIVGLLYHLSNIIQCIGRLRSSQRRDGTARVIILITESQWVDRGRDTYESKKILDSLSALGLPKLECRLLLTKLGIREWFDTEDCLKTRLQYAFRYTSCDDCNACTNCIARKSRDRLSTRAMLHQLGFMEPFAVKRKKRNDEEEQVDDEVTMEFEEEVELGKRTRQTDIDKPTPRKEKKKQQRQEQDTAGVSKSLFASNNGSVVPVSNPYAKQVSTNRSQPAPRRQSNPYDKKTSSNVGVTTESVAVPKALPPINPNAKDASTNRALATHSELVSVPKRIQSDLSTFNIGPSNVEQSAARATMKNKNREQQEREVAEFIRTLARQCGFCYSRGCDGFCYCKRFGLCGNCLSKEHQTTECKTDTVENMFGGKACYKCWERYRPNSESGDHTCLIDWHKKNRFKIYLHNHWKAQKSSQKSSQSFREFITQTYTSYDTYLNTCHLIIKNKR